MQDKELKKNFWRKLLHKYRFVIMTDDSFEERLSLKVNRLNLLIFGAVVVFGCFLGGLLLIIYTPMKEYVPGKSSASVQEQLIKLIIQSDSLKQNLKNRELYIQNINNIISGRELTSPDSLINLNNTNVVVSDFEKSTADSLLRLSVEAEDVGAIINNNTSGGEVLMFFQPIKGIITDKFNKKNKHFGVDLVAKEKARISSVLDGTVIISSWTFETGYVVGVQHKNGYFSLYKHNSALLKEVGDYVDAGDHIAIIGNSGELSYGPHLHFELWHKGNAVDPENYISF